MQALTDRAACVAAPQQQHQPPPPATRRSPQGAESRHEEGDRCAAPHGRLGAPPGPRPRRRPPRRSPTRHVPRQQQQAGGNEDILSSATGPSTTRCSKDVTTHQHRPGARPGRPCPVPTCSGQPLPGERRFSSALGNRVSSACACRMRSSLFKPHLIVTPRYSSESVQSLEHFCCRAPSTFVPVCCALPLCKIGA